MLSARLLLHQGATTFVYVDLYVFFYAHIPFFWRLQFFSTVPKLCLLLRYVLRIILVADYLVC